jgi:hypothetical protein
MKVLLPINILTGVLASTQAIPFGPGRESRPPNCSFDVGYDVQLVENQARRLSAHSWEYGTAAEALLEFHSPALSVFGEDPFPGGRIPRLDWTGVPGLVYAVSFIRTNNETLIDGDGTCIHFCSHPVNIPTTCL